MIKVIEIKPMDTNFDVSYIPEIKNYNIVTDFMSDDCMPYRIDKGTMLWITKEGYFGEIESIYPITTDIMLCNYSTEIFQVEGFPKIEICSYDNEVCIQQIGDGFIIWLSKDKYIDTEVTCNKLSFLISKNELIAIKTIQSNTIG